MKTQLHKLFLAVVCCLTLGGQTVMAQQPWAVLMVEDFDTAGVIPYNWTTSVNTPAFPDPPNATQDGWEVQDVAGITASYGGSTVYWTLPGDNGGPMAVANDDQCNCDASMDVLTSPSFEMSAFDSLWFFFDLHNNGEYGSTGTLDFTTDGSSWQSIPLPTDPDWQALYLPLVGPFTDVQFSFTHSDGSTSGSDVWAGGMAVDSILMVGFNQPCDDIVTISGCDQPQTVSLSGQGVNDFNFTDQCGWSVPGAEQLYSFTPSTSGIYTLNVTATTGVSWLDYMYKPASMGCDSLNWTCIDDVQDPASYGINLTGGTEYLFLVDNEFADLEEQTFSISCPCTYVSQGNTPETETCGADLNGGCNTDPGPAAYEPIACGGSISGTLWADGGSRDTDWFELVVTENTDIVVDFSAGMPVNALLVDNCTDLNVLAQATAAACGSGNLTYAVTPGTYLLVILPTAYESYPCGSGSSNQYDATITFCESTTSVDPCLTTADTWNDLNNAGGAPCNDGNGCTPTDAGFTTFGIYGSETYLLDNVQAGYDYVFNMCSGFGAGSWIPEIAIVAPDGTTVDAWNGEAATGSSLTFIDNCSILWTASQSGTYSIIINQLGTAAGDAPNQVDCNTSYAVDNGNPTVECGVNAAQCLPCEAGALTSPLSQDVCPGETALIALDGSQSTPSDFAIGFSDVLGGTGGLAGGFTVTGYSSGDFPMNMDDDVNGTLSANSLDPLLGEWVLTIYARDGGVPCDSTVTMTVNFLDVNDPACIVRVEEVEVEISVNVYPNPSNGQFTVELEDVEGQVDLNVFDMTGRVVHAQTHYANGGTDREPLILDVSRGTYLLQIITASGTRTERIGVR